MTKLYSPSLSREGLVLSKIGKELRADIPDDIKVNRINDIYKKWCELIKKEYIDGFKDIKSNLDKS